jgi:hypothetical protein
VIGLRCALDERLAEMHAFISRCEISSVPYWDISATANKFTEFVSQNSGSIAADDRRLADRVLSVVDSRKQEAILAEATALGGEDMAYRLLSLFFTCASPSISCGPDDSRWHFGHSGNWSDV